MKKGIGTSKKKNFRHIPLPVKGNRKIMLQRTFAAIGRDLFYKLKGYHDKSFIKLLTMMTLLKLANNGRIREKKRLMDDTNDNG